MDVIRSDGLQPYVREWPQDMEEHLINKSLPFIESCGWLCLRFACHGCGSV